MSASSPAADAALRDITLPPGALPPGAIAGRRAGRSAQAAAARRGRAGHRRRRRRVRHDWWTVGRFQVATDDAYVAANSVLVSPKISGYLAQVLVQDNQTVHAGDVLARIDDRDYRTALDQAHADVAAAQADIVNLQQEIEQQTLTVAQARTLVAADQAAATFADQQLRRYAELARTGAGTVQQAQQYQADIQEKQATLAHDQAGIGVALKQADVLRAQLAKAQATLAQRQAADAPGRAEPELHHDHRAESTARWACARCGSASTCRPAPSSWRWCRCRRSTSRANYKETQLTDVRPGQPVADRRRHVPRHRRARPRRQHRPGQPARSSRCCRPTTPPATSPRSSSASR